MMRRPQRRRESGALLLMVALLLATLAALAFGMNRAAGMDTATVKSDYDSRAAGYLAEAAVAAAIWSNGAAGCTSAAVPATTFGPGRFQAEVVKVGSKNIDIVATGTAGDGTERTIERKGASLFDFSKKATTTDLGGAAIDTTIAAGIAQPDSGNTRLSLASGTSHALLSWPAGEITKEMRVLSATLTVTRNGAVATPQQVAVHRMKTQWDGTATWRYARLNVAGWTGGDFGETPVVTASVSGANGATASFDVTGLVDGWVSKRLANHGLLLRMPAAGQSAVFHSRDAGASQRPVLRVITAKAC